LAKTLDWRILTPFCSPFYFYLLLLGPIFYSALQCVAYQRHSLLGGQVEVEPFIRDLPYGHLANFSS
jgi:hypothetical protein